jgi:hypothetical protein
VASWESLVWAGEMQLLQQDESGNDEGRMDYEGDQAGL